MATTTKKTTAAKVPVDDVNSIKFEYNGTEYIMEYDRDSALQAENLYNISLADIRAFKLSTFSSLFSGAFIKHHPNMKPRQIDTFFDMMPRKADLFKNLVTMYATSINSLLEEPEEGKALNWTQM